MSGSMSNTQQEPTAPTGRGLTPKEYEHRRRIQAEGTTVGGEHHDA